MDRRLMVELSSGVVVVLGFVGVQVALDDVVESHLTWKWSRGIQVRFAKVLKWSSSLQIYS